LLCTDARNNNIHNTTNNKNNSNTNNKRPKQSNALTRTRVLSPPERWPVRCYAAGHFGSSPCPSEESPRCRAGRSTGASPSTGAPAAPGAARTRSSCTCRPCRRQTRTVSWSNTAGRPSETPIAKTQTSMGRERKRATFTMKARHEFPACTTGFSSQEIARNLRLPFPLPPSLISPSHVPREFGISGACARRIVQYRDGRKKAYSLSGMIREVPSLELPQSRFQTPPASLHRECLKPGFWCNTTSSLTLNPMPLTL